MDSSWRFIDVMLTFSLIASSVSARVCQLGTEPGPDSGWIRAVLSSADPCACHRVVLGGHNVQAQSTDDVTYLDIDHFLAEDPTASIRRFYSCGQAPPTGKPTVVRTAPPPTDPSQLAYRDCQAILDARNSASGVYTIHPRKGGNLIFGDEELRVYCRMVDTKGYIVFQRRHNGSENFDRTMNEYRNGFGSVLGEFWLGNERLRKLTKEGNHELRITLESFDGQKAVALYKKFKVNHVNDYKLIGQLEYTDDPDSEINAGNALLEHRNKKFSVSQETQTGGWWCGRHDCRHDLTSNLNGEYITPSEVTTETSRRMFWKTWKDGAPLKGSEMMMRKVTGGNN